MDWCDDVTYAVHDVIDCYRTDLIPLHQLFHSAPRKGKGFKPTREAQGFLEWLTNCYKDGTHRGAPGLEALSHDDRVQVWSELEPFFFKMERRYSPRPTVS